MTETKNYIIIIIYLVGMMTIISVRAAWGQKK